LILIVVFPPFVSYTTGAVGSVALEQGIHPTVMEKLKAKGHEVVGPITGHGRSLFGRGQIITKGAFWLAEGDV